MVSAPFALDDTKVVPCNYDSKVYLYGQEVKEEPIKPEEASGNITGAGGITRSGRVFTPVPPAYNGNQGASNRNPGKQVVNDDGRGQNTTQKANSTDEVEEFLHLIKKSDYKVVDQLNQTPSNIYMLSLLMSSKAHREALIKFLRAAHVPQEILVNQFKAVVANISASSYLGFNDDEFSPKGRNHNKVLHISIECVDTVLSRVLVDTESSLNVLPKNSLSKMTIEGLVMKPNSLIVRAFDGSRQTVIGEVDLPMKIGPHIFFIIFYMMDIYPTYSCLKGRPWIHSASAVTSTLHQRLKFMIDSKLVVVEGEKDIVVSHLVSFRYVEVGGETHETPFQAFNVVNVEMTPTVKAAPGTKLSMASWKDARTRIQARHPTGWGRVLDFPVNKDRSWLGFHSLQTTQKPSAASTKKGLIPAIPDTFTSAGHLGDNSICMMEEESGLPEEAYLVYQKAKGQTLNNWIVVDIPEVTFIEE
ncbi:uncharacterized protein LOC127131413 [Lathyrus oleraceus]|uniref:uncharacterized protein LOC127131413 n=1 Tax=Pisum sativum TaxID=3888 RepID=UPI0021CE0B7B|nr:uncharacterized protein LOC127131413 [Pisum sativum]